MGFLCSPRELQAQDPGLQLRVPLLYQHGLFDSERALRVGLAPHLLGEPQGNILIFMTYSNDGAFKGTLAGKK